MVTLILKVKKLPLIKCHGNKRLRYYIRKEWRLYEVRATPDS